MADNMLRIPESERSLSDNMLRTIVVGSGGIGGFLIDGLVRQLAFSKFKGNSALVIVDGDTYEPKNKNRQMFSTLGNKAIVKATDVTPLFPEVFISPVPKYVVDEYPEGYDTQAEEFITPADLLVENDIVFAVVDNHATRKIIFDAAMKFDNIDVFTGGNDEALFGSTYHFCRKDGKNVTDPPGDFHPELIDPPDRNPALLSCQERAELGGTQSIATNMAVAATLLGRFQHVVIEGNSDKAAEIMFDLAEGLAAPYDRTADEKEDSAQESKEYETVG